jgi:speckle-type POZ protein
MFEVDMKEAKERVVRINEVDPMVLRELLRFLYLGEVENMAEISPSLYELADRYLMDDLKETCVYYMVHNVTVFNMVDLFCLAKKFNIPSLCTKTKSVFAV